MGFPLRTQQFPEQLEKENIWTFLGQNHRLPLALGLLNRLKINLKAVPTSGSSLPAVVSLWLIRSFPPLPSCSPSLATAWDFFPPWQASSHTE